MYCSGCGNQIADDSKFCQKCGAGMQGGGVASVSAGDGIIGIGSKPAEKNTTGDGSGVFFYSILLVPIFTLLSVGLMSSFGDGFVLVFLAMIIGVYSGVYSSIWIEYPKHQSPSPMVLKRSYGVATTLLIMYALASLYHHKGPGDSPKLSGNDTKAIANETIASNERSKQHNSKILRDVWNGYMAVNVGTDERPSNGKLIKEGTVPPAAMNSSVDGRLPAYLACYDVLMVTSFGDSKVNMCIYYIENPTTQKMRVQWKGVGKITELYGFMDNDGFVEK